MLTHRKVVLLVVAVLAGVSALGGEAAATTLLRLDGIGPLRLGMTQTAAVATGWLTHRSSGCPLGGPPVPVDYRLAGPRAPRGLRGFAEFRRGRLRVLWFTRGVRTGRGVVVHHTTLSEMASRYRRGGFRVREEYDEIFGGTFVLVRPRGGRRQVLGGFGQDVVTTVAIPYVPICD